MADRPDLQIGLGHRDDGTASDALRKESHDHQQHTVLQNGIDKVASVFTSDDQTRAEITHYTTAGLKTAALFLGGRVGIASTVGLYAADQINPNDSAGTMLVDGSLGALKGAAMKGTFALVGGSRFDPAVKALALGVGSRLSDTVLDRAHYYDAAGKFDMVGGLQNAAARTFDQKSIGTDVVTFGLSYGLFKGVNGFTNNAIGNSRLLSNTFLGGSYGLISGANQEVSRQGQLGEFDVSKIAMRGLAMGAVDAFAAIPGGIQASRTAFNEAPARRTEAQTKVNEGPIKVNESAPVREGPPKLNLSTEQLSTVRTAAQQNGLWMMETGKVELAPDGTPKVMPQGSTTFSAAAENVSRLATQVNHAVTMKWNGVEFRIEPGMDALKIETAWKTAENAPERLEMYRRLNAEREQQIAQAERRAETEIEALRGTPARAGAQIFESLQAEAASRGSNFAMYAMSRLRHPAEIVEFTRTYSKFAPNGAGFENLEFAIGEMAQPGTAKVWRQAIEQVRGEAPTAPTQTEQRIFDKIGSHESMRAAARGFDLSLGKVDEAGITIEPMRSGITITEAGANAGRFAGSVKQPVFLAWNGRNIPIEPGATGPQVEALWRGMQFRFE